MKPGPNCSGYFNQWNQGKKSVTLNSVRPGAIDLAKRLIAKCDIVVENFATGVMDRLGLGYEKLRELRPDIIMASIFGLTVTPARRPATWVTGRRSSLSPGSPR